MQVFRFLLFPFSIIYGLVIWFRNRLFDLGILKSECFDVPLIIIGNLSTGGTGKTPHTEYLIRLLKENYSIAMLSRGYKRKTKGFVLADENATAETIGDEPMQIHSKFSDIKVAVCEDRVEGVSQILSLKSNTKTIILDDAFQHRWIRAGMNVLLTDYSAPFYKDFALPSGNLRDNRIEKRRAQVIIVTKCPPDIDVDERNRIIKSLDVSREQSVYFSKISYKKPIPFFKESPHTIIENKTILITGIANTDSIVAYVNEHHTMLKHLKFHDHHDFSSGDIQDILDLIDSFVGNGFSILTTEKDYVRLKKEESFKTLPMFYLPIEVDFVDRKGEFDTIINQYLKESL